MNAKYKTAPSSSNILSNVSYDCPILLSNPPPLIDFEKVEKYVSVEFESKQAVEKNESLTYSVKARVPASKIP